jgi:hypothetical protein
VCVTGVDDTFVIADWDKVSAVIEDRPVFLNKGIERML